MATMDIFETDAFSVIELTRALENIPFKPATLSGSGLFSDRGVRSRTVVIESRDGTLSLIPFSERGSAYDQQVPEHRDVRAFVCRQFKKQDVLWASEVQGIRAFGSESETQQIQAEVARRLRRLRSDAEATFEYHLPDIPQVERPPAHIVAVLRSDQASWTRGAVVRASDARTERDFRSRRRGRSGYWSDRPPFG